MTCLLVVETTKKQQILLDFCPSELDFGAVQVQELGFLGLLAAEQEGGLPGLTLSAAWSWAGLAFGKAANCPLSPRPHCVPPSGVWVQWMERRCEGTLISCTVCCNTPRLRVQHLELKTWNPFLLPLQPVALVPKAV